MPRSFAAFFIFSSSNSHNATISKRSGLESQPSRWSLPLYPHPNCATLILFTKSPSLPNPPHLVDGQTPDKSIAALRSQRYSGAVFSRWMNHECNTLFSVNENLNQAPVDEYAAIDDIVFILLKVKKFRRASDYVFSQRRP